MKNKFGLSRDIPEPIMRQRRQACGFGCVICGASIYEYEHIDPPFAEATCHDPDKMTLLCHQCHGKVTRGFLSKQSVLDAMKSPHSRTNGYANEAMDITTVYPEIVFAGVILRTCRIPIMVNGFPLFEIKEAEVPGGPFRLNARFYNSRGQLSLCITDNKWRAFDMNWDVEAIGGVITIRDNPGHISLQLRVVPPSKVIIERLDMYYESYRFLGNAQTLEIVSPNGSRRRLTGCIMDNAYIGMMIGRPYPS